MFGKINNSVEIGYKYFTDCIQVDPSLLQFRRLMQIEVDAEIFEMLLKNENFKIIFDDIDCLADAVLIMYLSGLMTWDRDPRAQASLQDNNLKKIKLLTENNLLPDYLYNDKFFEHIWLEWDHRMPSNLRKYARVWQTIYYATKGDGGLIFE